MREVPETTVIVLPSVVVRSAKPRAEPEALAEAAPAPESREAEGAEREASVPKSDMGTRCAGEAGGYLNETL